MSRTAKRLLIILGLVLMIPAALVVVLWLVLSVNYVPSSIADFRPSKFRVKAANKFFYSANNGLKYSDEISSDTPTLLASSIDDYLVSPDNEKIAVVSNGKLLIVNINRSVQTIAPVDSIYREPRPLGRSFFRDSDFQWSKDSNYLYLIRDKFYESRGSQLYSDYGELWRYELASGKLQLVLKPFPAYTYFFGLNSGIYFSSPTETGDLRLRYFDGRTVREVKDGGAYAIPTNELNPDFVESPFFSFSHRDYSELYTRGARLEINQMDGTQKLVIGSKNLLTLTRGNGIKGAFYCSNMGNSAFLPGRTYFLFSASYCKNYNGQLLFDTTNGEYERLPMDSHVYLNLNTENTNYRISCGGMMDH